MKCSNYFVKFFMLAISVCLISSTCVAFSDEGFQWWSSVGASAEINKDWKVKFSQEFRLGEDGGNLYYQHSDLGFIYSGLAEWVDIGLHYRQVTEKDGNDRWRRENRPHLNFTLKTKFYGLSLSDRNMFEYRERDGSSDGWRYRNKLTAKFPVKLTALQMQPYVADEVFMNFDENNYNRNRLYAGVVFELIENISCDIYYIWQKTKSSGNWGDVHVLGTGLKVKF